jgi:hypothetical protein
MPGSGEIGGGGSVYAKFRVGRNPNKPISEAEVFDPLAKGEITFIFPRGVNLTGAHRNEVTVRIPRNKRTRVKVEWR